MDSNTNYVPVSKIFDIKGFYDQNYTGYCKSFGPKIVLLFDLLSGVSYERAVTLKQVDQDTIEYSGNAYSLLGLYDRLMGCRDLVIECDTKREDLIPNLVTDPIDRFIRENGTCIVKDISEYTIKFHRVR